MKGLIKTLSHLKVSGPQTHWWIQSWTSVKKKKICETVSFRKCWPLWRVSCQNKDVSTTWVFDVTLKFYWSEKSADLRITALQLLKPLQIPAFKEALSLPLKALQTAGRSAFHTVRTMINYLFGLANRIYVPLFLWHGHLNFLGLVTLLNDHTFPKVCLRFPVGKRKTQPSSLWETPFEFSFLHQHATSQIKGRVVCEFLFLITLIWQGARVPRHRLQ